VRPAVAVAAPGRFWSSAGYTLVEVVVGIALGALVVLAAGAGYIFVTRSWGDESVRLDVQQTFRATAERLVRELRLAGVCLPLTVADLHPVVGANAFPDPGVPERDAVTVRMNLRCASTTLRAPCNGCVTLSVQSTEGFVAGEQVYVVAPATNAGEFARIRTVDGPGAMTLEGPLRGNYPGDGPGAGPDATVYAVETQDYATAVQDGVPVLLLAVNRPTGGQDQLMARGVERFNVRYVLNRLWTTGSCDDRFDLKRTPTILDDDLCVKDQPTATPVNEWTQVRYLLVDLQVRSLRTVRGIGGDGYVRIAQTLEVKPRNLLQPFPTPSPTPSP
jgi:hypothetical protein